jgi:predicted amidophosphoribosyltransferase
MTGRSWMDLVLPRRCVCCGDRSPGLCPPCTASLPAAPDLAAPPGLAACWSLLRYEGTGRDVVAALKFRHHHDALGLLGAAMAELVDRHVDVVTWAPTSARRRRRRGFDQAELLASEVAARLGRPCRALLRHSGSGTQTGRGRDERLRGASFECTRHAGHGAVLVVDDVRTTGATLCAAGDALVLRGHDEVIGLTLAVRV